MPAACPSLDLYAALQCVMRRGLKRVVWIGDSVSGQLARSARCEHVGHSVKDSAIDNVPLDNDGMLSWNGTKRQQYRAPFWLVDGVELVLFGNEAGQYAEEKADALRAAHAQGLLQAPAVFMVNLGLFYLLCDATERSCDRKPMLTKYQRQLSVLFATLCETVRGPIVWRDTTAVHSHGGGNRSVLERLTTGELRRKFARFDVQGVRELNDAAEVVLRRFAPRVQRMPMVFEATAQRPDGVLPGDMRHYGGEVLHELLGLHYECWCGELCAIK